MNLNIRSQIHDYAVYFERDLSFLNKLSQLEDYILIVDNRVLDLYKDPFEENFTYNRAYLFEAIEENKSFESAFDIYKYLINRSARRNTTLISVGGGITQDVSGFVASTLYRGMPWVYVPTTLLAQADSCIGSKTSLNFESAKNLIGTFYPPHEIYIYLGFLKSLSRNEFYSGLGEIIKFQLMKEEYPKDFKKIADKMESIKKPNSDLLVLIEESLRIKISYMEGDEFDLGRRNLLNYGHCFGHALEAASEYYVPHGIGIMIGMIFANLLSGHRSLLDSCTVETTNEKLLLPNIPLELKEEHFDGEVLLKYLKKDKKRLNENLAVIIPDREFRLMKVTDVTEEEFYRALNALKKCLLPSFKTIHH